jgi:hypothetical protein
MGHEDLMLRVERAHHGLIAHDRHHLARPPSGFLLDLTGCRLRGVLPRIDQAPWQLPSPTIRHEPVTPKHEDPLIVVQHYRDRRPRHAHNVVLEAFSAGRLDIDKSDLKPLARVERALPVDPPAHAFVLDHHPSMADDSEVACVGVPPVAP